MDIGTLIDDLVKLVDEFDPTVLLPDLSSVLGWIEATARLFVMIAPLVVLGLGLWYLFAPPKEANHIAGYRFYYGMGSVEAWQYTQRLAGLGFTGLGGALTLIMGIISLTFNGKNAGTMIGTALGCVIWELVLIGLCCIGINVLVGMNYDKDGNRRPPRK